MVATIPFNYMPTTNAYGAFTIQTDGGVQGVMEDDPAVRWAIRSGVVATTETLPMWGGCGISELIPTTPSNTLPTYQLGDILGRATTLTQTSTGGLTGFSLFNQAYNMPTSPQSPVPMAASGMTTNYVRLGTGARVWVACDPSLVSLEGGVVGQSVSWDFNNQRLQPYETTATYSVTSVTWSSANGGQGVVVMGVASPVAGVGDALNISGATNTGTGGTAAVNGNFIVTAFTNNENFTIAMPAETGVIGTIAGTMLLNYGTGALACRINRILAGNSMQVIYNALTGQASWIYNGTLALITI